MTISDAGGNCSSALRKLFPGGSAGGGCAPDGLFCLDLLLGFMCSSGPSALLGVGCCASASMCSKHWSADQWALLQWTVPLVQCCDVGGDGGAAGLVSVDSIDGAASMLLAA